MKTPLTTIHHIAVSCDHPPASIPELRALGFEFEVVEEHHDWVFLKFANLFVALVRPGYEHVGIVVPSEEFLRYVKQLNGSAHTHRDGSVGLYVPTYQGVGVEFLDEKNLPTHLELPILSASVNQ
jgi:hypothetical protein